MAEMRKARAMRASGEGREVDRYEQIFGEIV